MTLNGHHYAAHLITDIVAAINRFHSLSSNETQLPNTTVPSHNMAYFQYISIGINIPFLLIFAILLLLSIAAFVWWRHVMNRNQKILYLLIKSLCVVAMIGLILRICTELAFLHPVLKQAELIFTTMKAFDRVVISWSSFVEFFLLCHVSIVFLKTAKEGGAMTLKTFKIIRGLFVALIVVIVIVGIITTIILATMGGIITQLGDNPMSNIVFSVTLIFGAVTFTATSITVLCFLHYNGGMLLKTLRRGELKVRQMQQVKENGVSMYSQEQLKTINMKKHALKKAWILLTGVTIDIGVQIVGFVFLPLGSVNRHLILVFYCLYNVTLVAMVLLFLGINSRLSEVYKVFFNFKRQSAKLATPVEALKNPEFEKEAANQINITIQDQ